MVSSETTYWLNCGWLKCQACLFVNSNSTPGAKGFLCRQKYTFLVYFFFSIFLALFLFFRVFFLFSQRNPFLTVTSESMHTLLTAGVNKSDSLCLCPSVGDLLVLIPYECSGLINCFRNFFLNVLLTSKLRRQWFTKKNTP